METTTTDLSWLCLVVPTAMIIVIAFLGTRSRLRYARRILDAHARDGFADMNRPEAKSRFRRFALLALIGIIGMISSVVMLFQPLVKISIPFVAFMAAFGVFGIIATVAGFLMQREIDRRL